MKILCLMFLCLFIISSAFAVETVTIEITVPKKYEQAIKRAVAKAVERTMSEENKLEWMRENQQVMKDEKDTVKIKNKVEE